MKTARYFLNVYAGGNHLINNVPLSEKDYNKQVNDLVHDPFIAAPDVVTAMFFNHTHTVHRFVEAGAMVKFVKLECKPGFYFYHDEIREVIPRA